MAILLYDYEYFRSGEFPGEPDSIYKLHDNK